MLTPRDAVRTLEEFLAANKRRDEAAMRACLTKSTLESGSFHGPDGQDAEYVLGEPRVEGESVTIPVRVLPAGAPPDAAPDIVLPCILVQEDGRWKLDLATTMERAFGGVIENAVQQVAGAMEQAVDGVASAMQAALGGTGEEAPAQARADASLEASEEELLPLAPMRTLPLSATVLSEALGFDASFAVDMENVLARAGAGPDQEAILFDWFEQSLFPAWARILGDANARTPLDGRLLGVRIEAVSMPRERFVAVDGNHIVYRLSLPDSAGFYSDAELAQILPAVAAGLPDSIDARAAEHRLLPTDDERPSLALYRERVVPRHRKRISALLDRPLELDVAWDDLFDSAGHAVPLSRWGTNRILGAIAYACADEAKRAELARDLKRIRLEFVSAADERAATYADGELKVMVQLHGGEAGCFYEHEIAAVL